MDGGELSQGCEITQELRPECILSPLLVNVFFAAALGLAIVRFTEDGIILKDIAYREETGKGAETSLERVRRAA